MEFLREDGWVVEKVEFWNPFSRTRKDLFDILDLLCIHKQTGKTMGVQVTTMGKKNPHILKMTSSKNLSLLLQAGWKIQLHSWRKLKKTGWTVDIKEFEK